MTRIFKDYLIAQTAFLLAAFGLVGCGDSSRAGASEDPNQFTASIEGVVEKGPFVKGTSVTLYELNPETFAQTGKVFTGTVEGDNGGFSLGKVELDSRYVLLEASGYYWNELWGHNTDSPLSLKAVAHVSEESKVNINIGTHITHKRILSLIESGMDFDEAKEQAESELIKAIFGDDSGLAFENASIVNNDKLLALSIMVLKVGGEAAVTEMIADLTAGVTPELLLKLADKVALQYSYDNVMAHMKEKYPDATIGPFQAYIYNFWQKIYGLGECSEKTASVLDTVHAENSVNDGKVLVCKEAVAGSGVYLWFEPTEIEKIALTYEPIEDGRMIFSESNPNIAYIYDGGSWRESTASEVIYGRACLTSADSSITTFDDGIDYLCFSHRWVMANISHYKKEMFFNNDVEYGSVKDERDGRVYKTVEIAGRVWMAENLSLKENSEKCFDVGCRYFWAKAMKVDGVSDSPIVVEKNHQGVCMDGWHIPDSTEWISLLNEVSIEKLKSSVVWQGGTNESGFSITPTGFLNEFNDGLEKKYKVVGNIVNSYATFVTSDYFRRPYTGAFSFNTGYGLYIDNDCVKIVETYEQEEYNPASVRCVKDSE